MKTVAICVHYIKYCGDYSVDCGTKILFVNLSHAVLKLQMIMKNFPNYSSNETLNSNTTIFTETMSKHFTVENPFSDLAVVLI